MKLIVLIVAVPNEGKNPLEIKATQGNIEHTPKPRIISTKSTSNTAKRTQNRTENEFSRN